MLGAGYGEFKSEDGSISRIFDIEAESCLSDEAVQRLLSPLRERILSGEFSKPRRRPLQGLKWLAPAVAAVIVLVSTARAPGGDMLVEIPEAGIPLTGAFFAGNTVSGRVTAGDEGVGGVGLTLVDAGGMSFFGTVLTDINGNYAFEMVPDGSYRLKLTLPPGMDAANAAEGEWLLVNGDAEFDIYASEENREGMEIPICLETN